MNAIERIASYHIPTDSFLSAIRYLNDRSELTPEEYRFRIVELTGKETTASDEHVRHHYLYLIQETVRQAQNDDDIDMKAMFDIAAEKAEDFLKKNAYIFAKPDVEPKLDAAGNPKPKKGAKKEMAKAVYEENKDKGLTRKQFIELLVKEVGLTSAGASTYYANMKAGRM